MNKPTFPPITCRNISFTMALCLCPIEFCVVKTKQVINVRILSPSIYRVFLIFLLISPVSAFAQELNLGFEQIDTKTGLPLGWSPKKDMEQCFSPTP